MERGSTAWYSTRLRFAGLAALLIVLAGLAFTGLRWGVQSALVDSADLWRRVEEVRLFEQRIDPFTDPDCTYPPSALPVFEAILGAIPEPSVPRVYTVLNLITLALFAWLTATLPGSSMREPPAWCIALWIACLRPVRAGLALGQFHLMPIVLALLTIPLLRKNREIGAGVLLGLALTKPTMVFPLVATWLFTGRIRAVLAAGLVQAGLTLGASLWLNRSVIDLARGWLANARGQIVAGTIDLPSLAGTWGGPSARQIGTVAVLAASVGMLWLARRAALQTQTALALALAAIGTYHRHYDLGLLAPAVVMLMHGGGDQLPGHPGRWSDRLLALLLAGLLIVPTNPTWIRSWANWIDGGVIVLSYLVIIQLAIRASVGPPELSRKEVEGAVLAPE